LAGLPYTTTEPSPLRFSLAFVGVDRGVAQPAQFQVDGIGLELLRIQAAQAAQAGFQQAAAPTEHDGAGALQVQVRLSLLPTQICMLPTPPRLALSCGSRRPP
jgi:hypothetical protein